MVRLAIIKRARRADGVPARFSPTSRHGRTLVRATVGDARGLPRAPGFGRARVRLDPRGVATRHATGTPAGVTARFDPSPSNRASLPSPRQS